MDIDRRLNDKREFTPGLIFNLKNNFDWKDKTEVDNNIRIPKPILDDLHNYHSDKEADKTQEEN
jgi:hypothetical protein